MCRDAGKAPEIYYYIFYITLRWDLHLQRLLPGTCLTKKLKHIFCHKIQIFLGGTLLFFVNYLCVFVTNVQIWSLAESICFKLSLSAINIRCVIGNIGEWKKLVQINWFTIKYVFKMDRVKIQDIRNGVNIQDIWNGVNANFSTAF